MLNDCNFMGRLGKDPELRHSASGKTFATFSIAVDKGYGENKRTIWINATAFDKTAEAIAANIKKGQRVYLKGELDIETYKDSSGQERTAPKLLVNKVVFLDKKETSNEAPALTMAHGAAGIEPDDIPF